MWMVVPPLGPKQAQAKRLLLVRATRIGIQMDSGAAGVRTHGHAYKLPDLRGTCQQS